MFPAAGLWQASEVAVIFITVRRAQLQPRPAGWKPQAAVTTAQASAGLDLAACVPSLTSRHEHVPGRGRGTGLC